MRFSNPDIDHVWLPCTQMKDCEELPPLKIASAKGSYLTAEDGRKIIDAISSWWCKSLGHGHPRIKKAFLGQISRFEHIIGAGTSNKTLAALSSRLAELFPPLDKIFYAGDGSTSVEIAMKMSAQFRANTGNPQKKDSSPRSKTATTEKASQP